MPRPLTLAVGMMCLGTVLAACSSTGAPSSSPTTATTPVGPSATVPNVDGMSLSQAVQILTAHGFAPDDQGLSPNEIVIHTEPLAGTYSGGNAIIHIYASPPTTTTTQAPTVAVPNVTGETITAATAAMAAVGLTLNQGIADASNIVAYTDPAAGTMAPVNEDVGAYSCAAGMVPTQLTTVDAAGGTWVCDPGSYFPVWGGQ